MTKPVESAATNGTPDHSIQSKSAERLLRFDEVYNSEDRQTHLVKTVREKHKPDRFSETALVVRRIFSKEGEYVRTKVDIKSPLLQDLFRDIFKDVDGFELNKSPPMVTPEQIFWAVPGLQRKEEEENLKSSPDQQLIDDIGTALRFVEEDFQDRKKSLESMLEQKELSWDLLWMIFPPREVVLAPQHKILNLEQAFTVSQSGYSCRNGTPFFYAEGSVLHTDGQDFGHATVQVVIDAYAGARKIHSLDFYPLSHHSDAKGVRERLLVRGKKYLSLLDGPMCRDYSVPHGVQEVTRADGNTAVEKFNAQGRVMIDPEGYYLHNTDSLLNQPEVSLKNVLDRGSLTDDQIILCSATINGFSFSQKTWCQVAVAELSEVAWNEEAFQRLVIDEQRRSLIHGMVKAHRHEGAAFDDIIANKGQGLIALLTGSPGVGKTLTAEAVAEVTRRPLYVVATGELGIDADAVDRRLQTILDITRRWGCVLLIDEADVFMAARGKDLARDALVSVFLRRLEYFRGVAILTTNRKREIDEAFQSRIHFTVHYPDLNESSRQEVWRNFLQNVAKTSELSEFTDDDFAALSRRKLNGRQVRCTHPRAYPRTWKAVHSGDIGITNGEQIKNVVSCAVSLAREQNKHINKEDIERLLEIMAN